MQNITQGHDAFELVNIRAIHNGQDVKLVGAHPFECSVKALIGVDVRKIECAYHFPQRLIGILRQLKFQSQAVDNPDYAAAIHHEETIEHAWLNLLPCFPNRHFRWKRLRYSPHDAEHLTLARSLPCLRLREVYAILYRQRFVDRLLLKS